MPVYLIRLAQTHESFRQVELRALAELAGVELEFIKYEEDVRCHLHSLSQHLSNPSISPFRLSKDV
jgi:tRNA G10  N-methylase Trm11